MELIKKVFRSRSLSGRTFLGCPPVATGLYVSWHNKRQAKSLIALWTIFHLSSPRESAFIAINGHTKSHWPKQSEREIWKRNEINEKKKLHFNSICNTSALKFNGKAAQKRARRVFNIVKNSSFSSSARNLHATRCNCWTTAKVPLVTRTLKMIIYRRASETHFLASIWAFVPKLLNCHSRMAKHSRKKDFVFISPQKIDT